MFLSSRLYYLICVFRKITLVTGYRVQDSWSRKEPYLDWSRGKYRCMRDKITSAALEMEEMRERDKFKVDRGDHDFPAETCLHEYIASEITSFPGKT